MAVLTTNVAGNLVPPVNIMATLTKNKFNYKIVTIIISVGSLSWIFNNAYVFGVIATGVLYYIYIKIFKK